MKILITGGTGFAGTHLIHELQSQGFDDIYTTTFSSVQDRSELPKHHYISVDLTDGLATRAVFEQVKPDWVFHLASFAYVGKSFEKARELLNNNIALQVSVLDAVKDMVPKARILTIGSAEEYGVIDESIDRLDENYRLNPVNPYGVSKVAQDLLAGSYFLSYGLDVVRARSFNHIGAGQSVDFAVPAFAKQIVDIEQGKQRKLQVGNLTAVRDFTSVHDIVKAYVLLLQKGKSGEIYNIGSGVGVTMQNVVDELCSLSTVSIEREVDTSRFRPLDVPKLIADNSKIAGLGWSAKVDLKDALLEVLTEWRGK